MNIATHLSLALPESASEREVADAVREVLSKAVAATAGGLSVTAQVGPDDDFEG